MTRRKRALVRTALACGIVALLLAAIPWALNRWIGSNHFKESIVAGIEERSGCRIDFQKLEFSIFPRVRLTGYRGSLAMPEVFSGFTEALTVTPRLIPLLRGNLELAEIHLKAPRVQIMLNPLGDDQSPIFSSASPSLPTDLLQRLAEYWVSRYPGLSISIEDGSIEFLAGVRTVVTISHAQLSLSHTHGRLALQLRCNPDFAQTAFADVWIEPEEGRIGGEIQLRQMQVGWVAGLVPAGLPRPVSDSPVDVDLSFGSERPRVPRIKLRLATDAFAVSTGPETVQFRKALLEAAVVNDGRATRVEVSNLNLGYPRLNLRGSLSLDPAAQDFSYRIELQNTDLTTVRSTLQTLMEKNTALDKVFRILRGGTIERALLEARSDRLTGLKEVHSLHLAGRIRDGLVLIPGIDLEVTDVSAEVAIQQGILSAGGIEARTGMSTGHEGRLTVPVDGRNRPFALDIQVNAVLSELPPVLARVVKDKRFLRELSLMNGIVGQASGTLSLTGGLGDPETELSVHGFQVRGTYERVPWPLEFQGEIFTYAGSRITVTALKARMGKSFLDDVSGEFDWEFEPTIDLASPTGGSIDLAEIFQWHQPLQWFRQSFGSLERVSGWLVLDALEFKGGLWTPGKWRFWIEGRGEELKFHDRNIPDTFYVKSTGLSASPSTLYLKDCTTGFLDASLSVSGSLTGYTQSVRSADLTLKGKIGPNFIEWMWQRFHWPSPWRPGNGFTVSQGRLNWEKSGYRALSGVFQSDSGPTLSLDYEQNPEELSINELEVRDNGEAARLSLSKRKGAYRLGFQGKLDHKTVQKILPDQRLLSGSIDGNCTAQYTPDQAGGPTMTGSIVIRDLFWPADPNHSLHVVEAAVVGGGRALRVESARLNIREQPLTLKGDVDFSSDKWDLNLQVSADHLDWERFQGGFPWHVMEGSAGGREPASDGASRGRRAVLGRVHCDVGSFSLGGYTWRPLQALLTLEEEGMTLQVLDARLCDIPTPGTLKFARGGGALDINLDARHLDLDSTITCLWNRKDILTGPLDIKGKLSADPLGKPLVTHLKGNLEAVSLGGRVYHSKILAKIFALLNVTELFRGKLPDLFQEGCGYDLFKASGMLKDGTLTVRDVVLDGPSVKLAAQGKIRLEDRQVDFTVLVSPLRTVDRLIDSIPLVGKAMRGTLITIPVAVRGDLEDPTVVPLAPATVGKELIGLMKRIVNIPFSLQQPLF